MSSFSSSEALAIQQRSLKLAKELIEDDINGWITAIAIIGWMVSVLPKYKADELTNNLTEEVRRFPTYPKV